MLSFFLLWLIVAFPLFTRRPCSFPSFLWRVSFFLRRSSLHKTPKSDVRIRLSQCMSSSGVAHDLPFSPPTSSPLCPSSLFYSVFLFLHCLMFNKSYFSFRHVLHYILLKGLEAEVEGHQPLCCGCSNLTSSKVSITAVAV